MLAILLAASTIAQAHHKPDHAIGTSDAGEQETGNNGNGNGNGNNKGTGNAGGNSNSNNHENGKLAKNDGEGTGNNAADDNDSGSKASDSHNDDNEDLKAPPRSLPPQVPPIDDPREEDTVDEIVNIDEDAEDNPDEEDSAQDPEPPSNAPDTPNDDSESAGKENHATWDSPPENEQPEPAPVPMDPVDEQAQDVDPVEPQLLPKLEAEAPAPVVQELPFTFWVEGFVVFVLADPIFIDGEMLTGGTYQWDWGDGTVSQGDLFQTHHYAQGPDAYRVEMTRFNSDGDPTHGYTIEIDLVEFLYEDPQHVFENTHPLNVQSTAPPRQPTVESDVGRLIETVPVGPMPLFLLSALGMLVGMRGRLAA